MIQKIKSLIVFLFFTGSCIFSQTNFVAGEITKSDGNVVAGEIDYQEWKINPERINFRTKNDGKVQIYTLKDLSGFRIISKNETYKRAVVDVNKEPVEDRFLIIYDNLQSAAAYAKTKVERDSVFLLTVARGALNLYTLTDADRKVHFYIQKGDDSLKYLIYRVYIVDVDGVTSTSIRKTKDYARLLKFLTSDCVNLTLPKLENIEYNEKDLLSYVSAYNSCVGKNDFVKKKDKTVSSIHLIGGVELPFISLSGAYNPNFSGVGSPAPTIGVGGDFGLGRDRNKLSLGLEFFYKKVNTTGTNITSNNTDVNTNTFRFVIDYLHFNGGFKYILSKSKFNPYVKGGIGLSVPLKSFGTVEINSTDGVHTFSSSRYVDCSKSEFNLFVGFGVKTNRVFLETRVQIGDSLSQFVGENNNITYLSLLLGYSIFNF